MMAKEGSTIGGLMDVIGTETSMCLQYGVPLAVIVDKFSHMRFEPAGWTSNPDIPNAKSVVDYIFRWMGIQFIPGYREANTPKRMEDTSGTSETKSLSDEKPLSGITLDKKTTNGQTNGALNGHATNGAAPSLHNVPSLHNAETATALLLDPGTSTRSEQFARFQSDAPACDNCGLITVRNGNCYLCHNCAPAWAAAKW
ncbi:MAG: hypothetical protein R3C11_20000 [Planctomycetaceae bacterium]